MIQLGEASQDRFARRLEAVLSILQGTEPLQTILTLSVYGLGVSLTASGEQRRLYQNDRFHQAHVEIAQAFALRIPADRLATRPPSPKEIQALLDALPEVGEAFGLRRLVAIKAERSAQQQAQLLLQEHLRLHTQNVRNWGYFDRIRDLLRIMYQPLDDPFVEHLGISATSIVRVFEYLVRRLEQQLTEHWQRLHEIFIETSLQNLVHRACAVNPWIRDSPAGLLEFAARQRMSAEDMKFLILAYSERCLVSALIVTTDTVAAELGVAAPGVDWLFRELSLGFGDLADSSPENLLLDNPVWCKPLIRLGHDSFFCSVPQVLFSFAFPVIRELTAQSLPLKKLVESRRAAFLQSRVTELFANAFPGAEIVSGYEWLDGTTRYENDLLVRVDSHLLLIEVKSGSISWPSLRGAPARARRHIDDLLYDPSDQSSRLADRIKEAIRDPGRRDALLPNLPVRLEEVRTVLRISITLEDFATIQSNLRIVRDTGWIPSGHTLAPCILLSDLEIIFDVLEPLEQKLHYLRRRAEFEERVKFIGDELGLLGLYVATGFNVGEAESGKQQIHIHAMSKDVDEYYSARAEGIERSKPHLRLTPRWRDICAALAQRRFHQWTEVASTLLNVSPDDQSQAEQLFMQVKRNVARNWTRPNHRCSILIAPRPPKSDGVALYAFRAEAASDRWTRMQNIASQLFTRRHVQRCLVIAVDIDAETSPYSSLAMFFREDANSSPRDREVRFY